MVKTYNDLVKFIKSNPGYLKKGFSYINEKLNTSFSKKLITKAKKEIRANSYNPEQHVLSPVDEIKLARSSAFKKPIKSEFRRLFFDIETSFNIVSSWRVGYKINIGPENIIKERAIICICWKWQGEDKVYSLQWDKGNDKKMLKQFINVLNQAEEIVGQNSDRFDIKWLRTRCIYHNVPMMPDYKSLDTLKLAKAGFNFNSNKLDYMGQFLGVGKKGETGGFKLWQDIVMDNCSKSMIKMINYCKQDVILLEKVYDKLNKYTKAKTHVGVTLGGSKCSCPNCGSEERRKEKTRVSAVGIKTYQFQCKDCYKYYSVNATTFNTYNKLNMKK